ncbi:MAG: CCA tRNA nucleotidyltransferase [Cryomorphaceae bacterium]|nr:CCA tRNA nucleotidyltransferase [Cryomorphaceae bacterium]
MEGRDIISDDIFKTISNVADAMQVDAYVVGGYVRDYLLRRPLPNDIDVVAVGSGIELAEKLSQALPRQPKVTVFKRFGTAMLRHKDIELEFVGARKESYRSDSRKPTVENGTLEDDQRRRDFTINALAVHLNSDGFGELIDPFNGLTDLENEIIRTPLDPDITFSDDPLRMMRAIRFAAQLHFTIHPKTLAAIRKNADRLHIVSVERIMTEFNKIMMCERPSEGLALLFETGLLPYFLPEINALQGVEEVEGQLHKDNFYHTIEVVDNISKNTDNLWLRWAALLHDIGKPVVKKFDSKIGWTFHGHEFVGGKMVPRMFKRLKLPLGSTSKYVQKMVAMSSRPTALTNENVTDSAVRRLLFDAGDDIDDLMLLVEADITTKNERRKRKYLNNFREVRERLIKVEEEDKLRNWQPPISGKEIMETFNLPPGREVGLIKSAIKEAILDGVIHNDYDAAMAFMKERGKDILNIDRKAK